MAFDIGVFLFSELLKCPWCISQMTGNIMEDLVMLFLLPVLIMILFVYVLITDMKILQDKKVVKFLFGVGAVLFIVFGGFYEILAMITKTYFIIMIFLLGIFYFVVGHFLKGKSPSMNDFKDNLSRGGGLSSSGGGSKGRSGMNMGNNRDQIKEARHLYDILDKQVKNYEDALKKLHPTDITRGQVEMQLNDLKRRRDDAKYRMSHRQYDRVIGG